MDICSAKVTGRERGGPESRVKPCEDLMGSGQSRERVGWKAAEFDLKRPRTECFQLRKLERNSASAF